MPLSYIITENASLVEQLRSFPVGSHDDGPDALEMAVRMIEVYD